MKRVISCALVLILTCAFLLPAYAVGDVTAFNESFSDDGKLGGTTDAAAPNVPEWKKINSISVTFYISNNGTACVSYLASTKAENGVTANVYIEKQSLGFLWKKVPLSVSGNVWQDKTNLKYIQGKHSVRVSDGGYYRVVVEIIAAGEKAEKVAYTFYDKSVVKGDANMDGSLTASDARLILRRSARLMSFSMKQTEICDINGDGLISSADARIALQMSAGII